MRGTYIPVQVGINELYNVSLLLICGGPLTMPMIPPASAAKTCPIIS